MHSDVSGESRKKVKRERKIRSHHFLESLVELEVYLLQVVSVDYFLGGVGGLFTTGGVGGSFTTGGTGGEFI